MATLQIMENGLKRKSNSKAKRRSNPVTKTRVASFLKKNGMKMVAKATPNGKRRKSHRRHKRRNSPVTSSRMPRTLNGILGNTKNDAKQVGSVLAGAVATKVLSRIAQGFVQPYMSQFGAGQYTEIALDAVLALFVVPMLAGKIGGANVASSARLGGLLAVAFDGIEIVAPDALQWNPFNNSPVMVAANGQNLVTPKAVAELVQGVADSANPQAEANKVAGAMLALDTGTPIDMYSGGQMDMLPRF